MRASILLACVVVLASCAAGDAPEATGPTTRDPGRAVVPTTRLVPSAGSSARDLDCADLADRDAAQKLFQADTRDPFRLDADDDGLACERN